MYVVNVIQLDRKRQCRRADTPPGLSQGPLGSSVSGVMARKRRYASLRSIRFLASPGYSASLLGAGVFLQYWLCLNPWRRVAWLRLCRWDRHKESKRALPRHSVSWSKAPPFRKQRHRPDPGKGGTPRVVRVRPRVPGSVEPPVQSVISAGGITGALNHALKQSARAGSVSQRERKPL